MKKLYELRGSLKGDLKETRISAEERASRLACFIECDSTGKVQFLMHKAIGMAILLFTACNDAPPVESAAPNCGEVGGALADPDPDTETGAVEPDFITFYGDLLPILSSNGKDQAYKCTTCHAHYMKPSGLNNVREVERIVESLRSGRMPRGGDPVTSAKIELFSMWRLQGFKEGIPKRESAPGQLDATVKGTTSASGCSP